MITITLLENKSSITTDSLQVLRYSYKVTNPTGTKIVAGENNATEIKVIYPESFDGYEKYVNMFNAKNESKHLEFTNTGNEFNFTLDSSMTYAGYTNFHFTAIQDKTRAIWDVVSIKIWSTDPNYTKVALAQPDVLADTIAIAEEALETANEALAIASHNRGHYLTPEDLQNAIPVGNEGDFATIESTDTIWIWDIETNLWVDSNKPPEVTKEDLDKKADKAIGITTNGNVAIVDNDGNFQDGGLSLLNDLLRLKYPNSTATNLSTLQIFPYTSETTGTSLNVYSKGIHDGDETLYSSFAIRDNGLFFKTDNKQIIDYVNEDNKVLTNITFKNNYSSIILKDTIVNTWALDNTYIDYPYRANILNDEVTEDMWADLVFNSFDADSGNYSKTFETNNGFISIWSKVEDTITIPTIKVDKI